MQVTRKRKALLYLLTHQVRLVLLRQVAMWAGYRQISSVYSFLSPLEEAGLITKKRALIRPLPAVCNPLATSSLPQPNLYKLTYAIRTRFRWPAKPTSYWIATQKASHLVGGAAPKLVLAQATHDAHLTAIYLAKLCDDVGQLGSWVGEDSYRQHGSSGKQPDALLYREGVPYRAIESAGCSYSANRIQAFIDYCNANKLEWELW